MRRERLLVAHRPPDGAWLALELAALDRMLGEGLVDQVRERVRAARDALRATRSCPGRPGGPIEPCDACRAGDDADLAIVERDIAARLATPPQLEQESSNHVPRTP